MISFAQARAVLDGTLEAARAMNAQPMAVVVLDTGGHRVMVAREDGATFFREPIAYAKAKGALGMGANTAVLAARAAKNPTFFQSVSAVVGGDIAFSPGGVLLKTADGTIVGAVGVSGDTGERDEQCAFAGLIKAGFKGEDGQ